MKFYLNTFKFPTVKVKATDENDENNKSYIKLIDLWWKFYKKKKHFHFIFDFNNLNHNYNLKIIPQFIKDQLLLKQQKKHYLDYSIVTLSNKYLIFILKSILSIISPIGVIYISNDLKISKNLVNYLNNPFISDDFIDTFLLVNNITKI
tara:strand:- start:18834 stop:19280 length:447 start_codon:yes stop_codon:yes gene_type:complete